MASLVPLNLTSQASEPETRNPESKTLVLRPDSAAGVRVGLPRVGGSGRGARGGRVLMSEVPLYRERTRERARHHKTSHLGLEDLEVERGLAEHLLDCRWHVLPRDSVVDAYSSFYFILFFSIFSIFFLFFALFLIFLSG